MQLQTTRNAREFWVQHGKSAAGVTAVEPYIKLLDPHGRDIDDPFGSELGIYRTAAGRIAEAVELRAAEIAP